MIPDSTAVDPAVFVTRIVTGVSAIVLKGSAFAHTAYADPSLRDFDDVDLLVPTNPLQYCDV